MTSRDERARASPAGLPSLAQGGDRIRSLGGPATARTRAMRRGALRARRPAGTPSERMSVLLSERGSPAGRARVARREVCGAFDLFTTPAETP
jgi:hypothetical protein